MLMGILTSQIFYHVGEDESSLVENFVLPKIEGQDSSSLDFCQSWRMFNMG
jgi:hypothetical protein